MNTRIAALALSAVVAVSGVTFSAPASAKACTNGVCASSTDDGRTLNIYLSTTLLGATHFNVRRNGQQVESSGRYSIAVRKGIRYSYHVQACARGGFLQKSRCTAWADFYHEVD